MDGPKSHDNNWAQQFMNPVPIPAWNSAGAISPVNPIDQDAAERSPYCVSLADFVLRFATSPSRVQILDGFLNYRQRLHDCGLVIGFQWLDGSFLEHVELLEDRPPNDIDIVTFFRLPSAMTQTDIQHQAPEVFPITEEERMRFKARFRVDPYFVNLNTTPERLVESSTYWYSMWSHRRNGLWKGYLQVALNPADDATAANHLKNSRDSG